MIRMTLRPCSVPTDPISLHPEKILCLTRAVSLVRPSEQLFELVELSAVDSHSSATRHFKRVSG